MIRYESRPIIVLGVERSGTSVVAEMVHRWGAYAGASERLHEADTHAPRGYWEYLPLWNFLAELGDFASGATWWDRDFQQRIEDKATEPGNRIKAVELMSEMHNGGPFFWKDPALAHFLPFWKTDMGRGGLCNHDSQPSRCSSVVAEVHYAVQCEGSSIFCRDEFAALVAHDDTDTASHRRFGESDLSWLRRHHAQTT